MAGEDLPEEPERLAVVCGGEGRHGRQDDKAGGEGGTEHLYGTLMGEESRNN